MSVIKIFNSKLDFWEFHPEFENIEEFKYIKDTYKKKSSDVMWFIVYMYNITNQNPFRNLDTEERAKLLSKDIVKEKNFWKDNELKLINASNMYMNLEDTQAKKHMRQWLLTVEKRTQFLKEAEYSLDNYDKLDKMATNTAALFKVFDEINKQMDKEEGAGTTKGGHIPSLADSDEI